MEFQNIKPILITLLIALIVSVNANAEKSDIDEKPPNITTESIVQDLRNSTTPASESKSRVKRQFGGYGYPGPYYGRRRPYPPIIYGGIGIGGGPGFGRGFGGRGFGGRGFGGRGGGFGGRGGGIGGRGGGVGGGHGGGGGRG